MMTDCSLCHLGFEHSCDVRGGWIGAKVQVSSRWDQRPLPRRSGWDEAIMPSARREPVPHVHHFSWAPELDPSYDDVQCVCGVWWRQHYAEVWGINR